MSLTLYVSPYLFYLVKEGQVILWDYKHHRQFMLTEQYFVRLREISVETGRTVDQLTPIDQELLEKKVINIEPYPKIRWRWDELGQIYHIGTQNISDYHQPDEYKWCDEYLETCKLVGDDYKFVCYEGSAVDLPDPDHKQLKSSKLITTLHNRSTSRNFKNETVSLSDLSTLLYYSFGMIHGEWDELKRNSLEPLGIRKAHPSGGGLHPIEAYVLIYNVEGVPPGLYHYDVKHMYLTRIGDKCSYKELRRLLCDQFFADKISFGVFLTAHFDKVWTKYLHSRTYKDVYLDAGHVSQTFLLVATALKLLTWETAWFNDTAVSEFLDIDGISTAPIFFVGAGYGIKEAIPQKMHKALRKRRKHRPYE